MRMNRAYDEGPTLRRGPPNLRPRADIATRVTAGALVRCAVDSCARASVGARGGEDCAAWTTGRIVVKSRRRAPRGSRLRCILMPGLEALLVGGARMAHADGDRPSNNYGGPGRPPLTCRSRPD